jgi:hypothetical protein
MVSAVDGVVEVGDHVSYEQPSELQGINALLRVHPAQRHRIWWLATASPRRRLIVELPDQRPNQ